MEPASAAVRPPLQAPVASTVRRHRQIPETDGSQERRAALALEVPLALLLERHRTCSSRERTTAPLMQQRPPQPWGQLAPPPDHQQTPHLPPLIKRRRPAAINRPPVQVRVRVITVHRPPVRLELRLVERAADLMIMKNPAGIRRQGFFICSVPVDSARLLDRGHQIVGPHLGLQQIIDHQSP